MCKCTLVCIHLVILQLIVEPSFVRRNGSHSNNRKAMAVIAYVVASVHIRTILVSFFFFLCYIRVPLILSIRSFLSRAV